MTDTNKVNSKKRGRPPKNRTTYSLVNNDKTITKNEDPKCPVCKLEVEEGHAGICCDICFTWTHPSCIHMSETEYSQINRSIEWICSRCLSIKANNIKWGELEGEEQIRTVITLIYDEATQWKKNYFMLPRGKSGNDLIKELTRLVYLFVDKTKWERLSISLIHIFLPIMLQKPTKNSKARENAKYLQYRLERWNKGDLKSLIEEVREIQKRLDRSTKIKKETRQKAFCRLMLLGKIGQAVKFIDNDDVIFGVHDITEEIKVILQEKHPKGKGASPDILLPDTAPDPQPVIYEEITAHLIQKAAINIHGSGGPTLIDSDHWKHIICSKSFGKTSYELSQAIADLSKRLCRDDIHPDCLTEFVACRLIPLDKGQDKEGNPGVRPIGIGEVLRRIVGKVVVGLNRIDIQQAAGPLQSCAGLRSGIEASVHAMKKAFEDQSAETVLMVDAENAFNNLNRSAALHNIKQLCPAFLRYLSNTYQKSAKLIMKDSNKSDYMYSDEGCTQGDVAAMALYALGIRSLIDILANTINIDQCKQSWYADDSTAAGTLTEIKKWWNELCISGPKFGYFPKPSKTILIVKNKIHIAQANALFGKTGIKIQTDGQRHLGAVIGSKQYKEEYVKGKVEKWIKDIEDLSEIAIEEPQAALSAYTKAICKRWTFLQRTIPSISHLFYPLEIVIQEKFIPAILGRKVSNIERKIIAMPVRYGGLDIANPVQCSQREYNASIAMTENVSTIIYNQENSLENFDPKTG